MDTERRIPIVLPSFACLVRPGTVPCLESQSWKAGGFAEMCKVTTDTHIHPLWDELGAAQVTLPRPPEGGPMEG